MVTALPFFYIAGSLVTALVCAAAQSTVGKSADCTVGVAGYAVDEGSSSKFSEAWQKLKRSNFAAAGGHFDTAHAYQVPRNSSTLKRPRSHGRNSYGTLRPHEMSARPWGSNRVGGSSGPASRHWRWTAAADPAAVVPRIRQVLRVRRSPWELRQCRSSS